MSDAEARLHQALKMVEQYGRDIEVEHTAWLLGNFPAGHRLCKIVLGFPEGHPLHSRAQYARISAHLPKISPCVMESDAWKRVRKFEEQSLVGLVAACFLAWERERQTNLLVANLARSYELNPEMQAIFNGEF